MTADPQELSVAAHARAVGVRRHSAQERLAATCSWSILRNIFLPVAAVGQKIGGKVRTNIDAQIFQNACPIRMSFVLNATGFPIRKSAGYETVSGSDKRLYLFRVNEMMDYLARVFGNPEKTVKAPKLADFTNMKGILVIRGHGWSNARGHVTLWDGSRCSDTCHLMYDPENGPFVPETASLWVVK